MPDDDDDGDDVNCPGGERLCSASGNHLTILGDDGLVVTLCHLRAESIPFALCPIDERYLYANAPRRCGLDGPWEGYRDPTRLDLRGVDAPLVRAGDFVGQVGTSGSGKGVHLHLQAKPHAFDGDNHCEGPSLPIAFADARYGRACEGVDPALARWIDLDGRVLPIDGHTLLLAGEE